MWNPNKAYLNYYNNNCYITPYSNVVVNKAGARPGGGLKGITNDRCFTGAGWCPCSKVQIHSKVKCGKVDGSIYECKSGHVVLNMVNVVKKTRLLWI